jgi:Zn-dependent M28 family amino/carboxypeptidase
VLRHRYAGAVAGVLATVVVIAPTAAAAEPIDSTALRAAVTVGGIGEHRVALQAIADANGGTRASGTPGFTASGDYVQQRLVAAGYQVTRQPFDFDLFSERSAAEFDVVSAPPVVYADGEDFLTMEYSGSGEVTAPLTAVDLVLPPTSAPSSTSGCEAGDFAGFPAGSVALIQRGTCDFAVKALNAQAAGASAAIIFNEGQDGRQETLSGTLGEARPAIPVIGTSFAIGADLAARTSAGPTVVHVATDTLITRQTSFNVIAETPGGRADRTVVVGAHLDSVLEGPGINDNGSGTATVLEIAESMSGLAVVPRNKVRFAFWGAEESGLIGSTFYVSQLSARQVKDIAVNLNFDMLGSPNFVRFVYDGDGSASAPAGPNGSGNVEKVFLDYFAAQGLATSPTAFDGRSDYGPFIDAGIPAGGLFSGAEDLKTAAEAAVYGGTAGVAHDPCYHQACDTLANNSDVALDQLGDAAAHSVLTFAQTTSAVNGTGRSTSVDSGGLEYRAGHQQR